MAEFHSPPYKISIVARDGSESITIKEEGWVKLYSKKTKTKIPLSLCEGWVSEGDYICVTIVDGESAYTGEEDHIIDFLKIRDIDTLERMSGNDKVVIETGVV